MRSTKQSAVPVALCAILALWAQNANGQQRGVGLTSGAQTASAAELMTLSLEELLNIKVTTASKRTEAVFDAPAVMVVVTESDIQSHGGRSLVEVIDRTSSVFFMGTQENLQGALTMRGDATLGANNHILLLVNGRPVQESAHGGVIHPFLRAFPLASVKQIEVVRGPGSVLYGTNAYVGVINVITKDWDSAGAAGASYGSFDTKSTWAAGGKTFGGLEVSAGVAASSDEGWPFTATDSIDEEKSAVTRTVPWFDRKIGATLNARYAGFNVDASFARVESPHLTNSSATTSWLRHGVSNATQAMIDLGYRRRLSPRWTSSVHGTFNHFFERADFGEIGERHVRANDYLVEWTNDVAISSSFDALFGGNVSKRTGSFYEATYDWYGVPDYNRNNFTAFGEANYRPWSRLKLIGGTQVIKVPGFDTYVNGGPNRDLSRVPGIPPHVVGRVGAIVTLADGLGAKVLYSQAFRQPSIVETDRIRYDEGDYSQEGNPELRPEEIATTDVQLYYGNEHVNAAVTVFDSRQSNVIAETESSDIIQNFDRFTTRGVEVEWRVQPFRHVELMSAMTYQRLNNATNPIFESLAQPVPPFMAKIGVSYRTESGLTVGLHDSFFATSRESRHTDDEDPANTTQYVNRPAGAFHNVTLNVGHELKARSLGSRYDLMPYLYVSNLLDEDVNYAEYTSVNVNSIPGRPRRALFFGVNVGF